MRNSSPLILALALLLGACAAPYASNGDPSPTGMEISTDSTYGYTEANPIRVGGALRQTGPANERAFLNGLRGPAGQPLRFRRMGSCCIFSTMNSPMGGRGLLDVYEVTYDGLEKPIQLYINMYDYERPKVPVGFTAPTEPTGGGGRLG
jgi:hypothetical protein